jgi:capsular polysaccharide biosynthesis protein
VSGRLGVLANRGDFNYCHVLLDVLPRLGVLERCPEIPFPKRWYAPVRTAFQRELIAAVGISPEQVIDSTRVLHVQAECLVVPGLPDDDLRIPEWVVGFLRSHLLPEGVERVPGRRLYVTRGSQRHSRIVTNGPEVQAMLAGRGFVEIDPGTMSVREQVKAFAEAEVIVAPHGAALTNLVFASPGSLVVEIFAPDYVNICFWALAERVAGLDYRYLVGEGMPRPGREKAMAGVASDITVDVSKLARLLDN